MKMYFLGSERLPLKHVLKFNIPYGQFQFHDDKIYDMGGGVYKKHIIKYNSLGYIYPQLGLSNWQDKCTIPNTCVSMFYDCNHGQDNRFEIHLILNLFFCVPSIPYLTSHISYFMFYFLLYSIWILYNTIGHMVHHPGSKQLCCIHVSIQRFDKT